MQYRLDKKSGNELSVLGFGCMRFPSTVPGKIDMLKTELLVLEAIADGINYFDTAYLYKGSEEALGTILQKNNVRDLVYLATKLPHTNCKKFEDFERLFAKSCDRLKTDYIDYYLIHNMASFDQWARLVDLGIEEWIAQKKASGEIKQIGFSFHGSNPEFKKIIDAYDWDFCQIQYNYANEHYQAGRDGLQYAANKGLPIVIMEPLLGGKLINGLPEKAKKLIEENDPSAGSFSQAAARLGLRWLWNQPEVTVVLSGMNTEEQLADNVAIASDALPDCMSEDERVTVDKVLQAFNESFKVPCTGCNYCMPCPQGINIPSIFNNYNTSYSVGWFTGVMGYFMSVGSLGSDPHYASDCIECGACMKKCPQRIQIPDELKKACHRLQPPGSRQIMKVASKVRL